VTGELSTVAVIGTGRMGGAMAATLGRAGFPVTVWNRDSEKARAVARATGARQADTAAEAVAGADISLSSLADDAAVEAVYLAADGVVAGAGPSSIVIDTSTIYPDTTVRIGAAVDETGASFADCPVSGSVATVEAGSLTIMAGGDPGVIDRARPVLDALASRVIMVGQRGAGSAAKLAVNGLVHGLNVALSEALVLAERAGVDRETAYDVFAGGAGGAPFVQYKREAYEHPEAATVAFSIDLVRKDLELITGLAARVGAPMRQAATGLDVVRDAIAAGYGEADLSAIAEYLRGLEG
jgi:3-hydroxyisobutyrate dehydrogenase-like beta-hydroxyacid dehydrogenase